MSLSIKRKRRLTVSQKKTVAGRQNYKCANSIGSEFAKTYDFTCLLWSHPERQGTFGKEGYEIDHIIEFSQGGEDSIENCQALCLSCHRVKTILFNQNKPRRARNSLQQEPLSLINKLKNMFSYKKVIPSS